MRHTGPVGSILLAAMLLGGCANSHTSEAECTPAQPGEAHAVAINSACPVEPGDSTMSSTTFVEHKGGKVALCCPGCLPAWNAMSDSEKDAALAKVAAK